MTKNTTPANIWDTLRRLHNCNKAELAARLGVTPRTLRRWEEGEAGKEAHQRASALLLASLRAAESDVHAQWAINWDRIADIGGRR
jgi:transcriptional regulator with XRE-family HTH domain